MVITKHPALFALWEETPTHLESDNRNAEKWSDVRPASFRFFQIASIDFFRHLNNSPSEDRGLGSRFSAALSSASFIDFSRISSLKLQSPYFTTIGKEKKQVKQITCSSALCLPQGHQAEPIVRSSFGSAIRRLLSNEPSFRTS
jgi:hypothetical protein